MIIHLENLPVGGPAGWRSSAKSHRHTLSAPEGGRGSCLVKLGTEGFESKDLVLKGQAFPWQRLQGPLIFPVGRPGLQDRQEVRPPSWRC